MTEGTLLTVLGWGTNSSASQASTFLEKGKVSFEPREGCQQYHTTVIANMIRSRTIAAQDTCVEDNGGPVVLQVDGEDFVAGLVSWGEDCAGTGPPRCTLTWPKCGVGLRRQFKSPAAD